MKDLRINESAWGIIEKSELIEKLDWESIISMKDELNETFQKSQMFRTRTEMEISVLNDLYFPTPASKYWQAVREQNVMFENLVELSYDYRKKVLENKKLQIEIDLEESDIDRELKQIELERGEFHLRQMEKIGGDRIREIKMRSEIKAREATKMSESELENVDNHQLLSYTSRWINQAIANKDNPNQAIEARNNLLGQLQSGLKECKNRGILKEILPKLSEEEILYLGLK